MNGLLLAGWIALCAGDATTTHVILQSGHGREVIWTQNPWVDDGIVAAQAAGGVWLSRRLNKLGHPRMAKAILVSLMVVRGVAVVNNLHVIQSARELHRNGS